LSLSIHVATRCARPIRIFPTSATACNPMKYGIEAVQLLVHWQLKVQKL